MDKLIAVLYLRKTGRASTVLEKKLNQYARTHVVTNAIDGIYALMKDNYDSVVMDMDIPVINAFETCSWIRRQLALRVPVIGIAVQTDKNVTQKSRKAGMNAIIARRDGAEKLFHVIERELSSPTPINVPHTESKIIKKKYDLTYLRNATHNDQEFVNTALHLFVNQGMRDLGTLIELVKNKDIKVIKKVLHRMKSSFALFKANEIAAMCTKMEQMTKKELTEEKLRKLIALTYYLIAIVKKDYPNISIGVVSE